VDIQRTAKQIGKAQDVVDLVGVIRPPVATMASGRTSCASSGVISGSGFAMAKITGLSAMDFTMSWVTAPFTTRRGTRRRLHRLFQRAQLGLHRMGRFPLVHALGPALVDHALGVADDAVLVPRAHGLQQFDAGDPRRPGPVQDDAAILDLLARQVQRVDQPGGTDHRRAVLVVMEHGDVHDLLQAAVR
jgi:hypothetical protein